MASDSQTATATTSEKPMDNKVNEEASLMEKEILLEETADVVKDKPVADSDLTFTKEEKSVQTPSGEPEKESPAEVEEVAAVVKAEESTEKVAEEVELKEPTLVKESVTEVIVQAVDEEKAEGKGKDENGEEKVAEQVELKEPIPKKDGAEEVKNENVGVEKAEEKQAVESVAEEESKDKEEEEEKMVDVTESTDETGGKQVEPVEHEPVDVQLVRGVSAETVDVKVLEVEPKPETAEEVEAQPERAKELAPETTEQAKVELEGKLEDSIAETKDSCINSKDEQTSESGSALSHEETVPINQDSDTAHKKETEGDASSLPDVIEKTITEENHVVDEPSKDEKASESVSVVCPERVVPTNQDSDTTLEKEAEGDVSSPPDVIEKATTEEKQVVEEPSKDEKENVSEEAKDENITRDTETPTANGKSQETLKETGTESTEGNKQVEPITEKVSEVVETATVAKDSGETKQEPEVTTKEVKHSRSIMSKVKQSLVKAKKAIIGKSPSSKTISTEETKEEIIAK